MLLALPFLLSVLVLIPAVQTLVVQYFTTQLSASLGTEISLRRVHFVPFKRVVVNDLLVRDLNADTLLFIPSFHASVDSFSIKQRQVYLHRIALTDPLLNVHKVDSVDYNFSFLTNQFFKGQSRSDSLNWKIFPTSVVFARGKGNVGLYRPNEEDFHLEDFNLKITKIIYHPDSISFNLSQFSFKERSGLQLNNAVAKVDASDKWLMVRKLDMSGNKSSLIIDSLLVDVSRQSTGMNFYDNSRFHADVTLLRLAPSDFNRLTLNKWHLTKDLSFSGVISGSPGNLKARQVLLGFGDDTSMKASIDLNGLPDLRNSFLFFDIKDLTTNPADILLIASATRSTPIELPDAMMEMGVVAYRGNITGFMNDLVAYGRLNSDYGTVRTDLGIRWKEDNKIYFAGGVNTSQFRLGKLLKNEEDMGNLSLSVLVSGSYLNENEFFTYLDGKVGSVNIKGYDYKNIQLSGLVNPRRFDGRVNMNDVNGQLEFMGKIDYASPMPQFAFEANGLDLNVEQLGIYPKLKNGLLSFGLSAYFTGETIDDVIGGVSLTDLSLKGIDRSLMVDSIMVDIERQENLKTIILRSDMLEGSLTGLYSFKDLGAELQQQLSGISPSFKRNKSQHRIERDNIFDVELRYHNAGSFVKFFYPDFSVADEGAITGRLDSQNDYLDLLCHIGDVSYKELSAKEMELHLCNGEKGEDKAHLNLRARELSLPFAGVLQNVSLQQYLNSDSLVTNMFWNNWESKSNSGAIYTTTRFERKHDGLHTIVNILPSRVMVADTLWKMPASVVRLSPGAVSVDDFRYYHNDIGIRINGVASDREEDKLQLDISKIDVAKLLNTAHSTSYSLQGTLNATIAAARIMKEPIVDGYAELRDLVVNNDSLGILQVNSVWRPEEKAVMLDVSLGRNNQKFLGGGGGLYYGLNKMDLNFAADQLPVGFLNFYLSHIIQNIKGNTSGKIRLAGDLSSPGLSARMKLNPSTFDVGLLKTSYVVSDSVVLVPDRMIFKNMKVADKYKNQGVFSGSIGHNNFSDMDYDLRIDVKQMLALDTKEQDNSDYYGTVFADGIVKVIGKTSDIYIDISGKSMPGSTFNVPLDDKSEAIENNFIRFASASGTKDVTQNNDYQMSHSAMDLNFDIEVTPDAKISVIFDGKNGDLLKGSGNGNINVRINNQGRISFFGEYVLDEGTYLFSFQNIVNKRFVINSGSTVRWEGDPYDAHIDLNATYKLKASLYDLVSGMSGGDVIAPELRRRVPINCNLMLTDRILRPTIRFDIETPSTQDVNQNIIDQYINSEEELNRQVLSLLILNKFYTPEIGQVAQGAQARSGNNAALVTTSEVLSGQLSSWLSQISNDFDVGVAYRPGDEITNEEIEVALSTQIFNNRVVLNGNVGYGRNQTAASNIIGDFDMEVKLNNQGTVRAKAYTHSNNDIVYETSPTTQGVGLSFREDFDTFGELMRKYWSIITGESRRKKKQQQAQSENGDEL